MMHIADIWHRWSELTDVCAGYLGSDRVYPCRIGRETLLPR